jgi:hypothetical protein
MSAPLWRGWLFVVMERPAACGRFKTFGIDSSRRLWLTTPLQLRFRSFFRNCPLPNTHLRRHVIVPTIILRPTSGGTSWHRPVRRALPSTPTVFHHQQRIPRCPLVLSTRYALPRSSRATPTHRDRPRRLRNGAESACASTVCALRGTIPRRVQR